MARYTLLHGSANPTLAGRVARALGVDSGKAHVERFPDGEVSVSIEQSVRGRDVYIVQPTAPPVDDNLIELLVFADACRRSSAARITAVIPYFGYARADRREQPHEPVTASLVASLIQCAGYDHVVTIDLHTAQLEGFFQIPVDNLSAVELLCDALHAGGLPENAVVVSPDAGRVKTATEYANRLGLELVVLHKRRISGTATEVTHVIGDVRGRNCIVIDDMIATGGTLVESIVALQKAGARPSPRVAVTHALLLGDALERLVAAGVQEVLATDTIAHPPTDILRVTSVAQLLADAIRHDYEGRCGSP